MQDFLNELEKYKDIKEILDIIDEVQELRHYYYNHMDNDMVRHVQIIMKKYYVETKLWNTIFPNQPTTRDEYFIGAENFLNTKSASILIKRGIKIANEKRR